MWWWDPSTCECECGISCDFGQYLDYVNGKYRKRLIDKLVGKCNEDIDRNQLIYNATLYNNEKLCTSCTQYVIVLIIAFVLIIMGISGACLCFHLYLKRNYVNVVSY